MGSSLFVFLLCLAEILSMAGTMYFPALLPSFQHEWSISNTEAGWINGIFFAGYALSSPVLVGLTDRVDPRRIYLPSALLGAITMISFGTLATGTWSAAVLRLLGGISLAGTYMPGLKALTDNITGPKQSRYIVFYTASYGLGMALSVFWAGALANSVGWQIGADVVALGPLAALAIFAAVIPKRNPLAGHEDLGFSLSHIRSAVTENRQIVGYIIGYSAHCWELFGFRSWLVALLSFSLALHPDFHLSTSPQNVAMVVLLLGVPATILGNEGAMKGNRHRRISMYMAGSGIVGCLIGFMAGFHPLVVSAFAILYGMTTMLDSGSLTAGIVAASEDRYRGLTLAVYSFTGFCMAFLAPLCFGILLDIGGGGVTGWGMAFVSLGLGCMAGPLALRLLR